MKFLENLGGWVLDHSWFTLPFAMISTFIVVYSSLPELAVLDGKHWECTRAAPNGITTHCVEYIYRGK